MRLLALTAALQLAVSICVLAQSPTATLSGRVLDPTQAAVSGASVTAINVGTNVVLNTRTNNEGFYTMVNLPPGSYRVEVTKPGFKALIKPDVALHVQDVIAINFKLSLGAVSESITVEGGAQLVNTESAAVSSVIDRNFAENLPLNGRSFQTLIQLTPGVVLTPYNGNDNGQFSVNGQRAASNYWTVDGVSANVGIGTSQLTMGNGLSGANAGFSVLGGTNSLVSVDAMQEFRIQTSTFAPEFGRTPGGQISIVTRSGTNQFHGTLFDYLRNDLFDANDWFGDHTGLRKPQERQNDFGGTFSGPILNSRTFFFFSYEGLRLRLPQVALSLVPDLTARQTAATMAPAMQPFLDAFPLPSPNTPDDTVNQIGQFNASYSNSASLDAYSLRIDHKLNNSLNVFGRYNYSPSTLSQRGAVGSSLNTIARSKVVLQTGTIAGTWAFTPKSVNEVRFNYSRTHSLSSDFLDNFGGAAPLSSLPFPGGFDTNNSNLSFCIFTLGTFCGPNVGPTGNNLQRQINVIDAFSTQKGTHNLKFGVDFRRLSPVSRNAAYLQSPFFNNVPSASSGALAFAGVSSAVASASFLFHNLGAFAQDTWNVSSRLTVTYGIRWDVDFAPTSNPAFLAVTGFNLADLSAVAPAPTGTRPFNTTHGNFAPRVGLAYQLVRKQNWQTVLRSGFGVFYDLATSEAGNSINTEVYPFGALKFLFGPPDGGTSTYPLSPGDASPPPIDPAELSSFGAWGVFDPRLKLPYTLEWNATVEQGLGSEQNISGSYVGARGKRLLQSLRASSPDPNFGSIGFIVNAATSDYDALQLQFRRRMSKGLQAVASYTWSHSIDTASAGSLFGNEANALLTAVVNQNRGPSDFDIRNALSTGLTFTLPGPKHSRLPRMMLGGWATETVFQAHSTLPVNVIDSNFAFQKELAQVRPDVERGVPLYLFGSQFPGGKAFNNVLGAVTGGCPDGSPSVGPFCPPPTDPMGNPLRQGNLGRNALRGFGAWQWDFALHRDFPIQETLKLEFRAEMFNVLNHPNFASPVNDISATQFGLSTQTLGNFLAGGQGGNVGNGAFNPLYQMGGPRSVQFAVKVVF